MPARHVQRVISGMPASDGAGVRLRRSLGRDDSARLDPFLMLDEIASDDAADYIAGFPPHPHRGFETVTYMLEGRMRHRDHLGNEGLLRSGGLQWMSAAAGIIHSEMPEQESGRLHGFQLWINLPAAEKMKAPSYADIPAERIPEASLPGGGTLRVLAGRWRGAGGPLDGPVQGISTAPLFLDLRLPAGAALEIPVATDHNALVYPYHGALTLAGPGGLPTSLTRGEAGILSQGDAVTLEAAEDAGALLLAARPLGEPVVQYGPFVMNSREEIEQALRDYREGRLAGTARAERF